jgi:hypothetical protein
VPACQAERLSCHQVPATRRPGLREDFFAGYGRILSPDEDETLFCYAVHDALSGLRWILASSDDEVVSRA